MIREMKDIDRGGLRLLTPGEINQARTLGAALAIAFPHGAVFPF